MFDDLVVGAVNEGRRMSSSADWGALLVAAEEVVPHRGILVVREADGYRAQRDAPNVPGLHIWRHWPGDGSVAMCA